MANEWVSGAFGFGGALVGAGVSLLQQRRDAARERQRRSHEAQLAAEKATADTREKARIAARILQADLSVARRRLADAADTGKFWSPHFSLPTESWARYREIVAQHVPLQAWSDVSRCFEVCESLEARALNARAITDTRRPPLSDRSRNSIQLALRRCDKALTALTAFTKDEVGRLDEADDTADD